MIKSSYLNRREKAMCDITFDSLVDEPRTYVELWKDLPPEELDKNFEDVFSRARANLAIQSEGDSEALERLESNFHTQSQAIKDQITNQIETNRKEAEKENQPPKKDDPLSHLNGLPFDNVVAKECISQKEEEVTIIHFNGIGKGFSKFEKTAAQGASKDDYFVWVKLHDEHYEAFYINHVKDDNDNFTDDLKLILATDNEQFLARLESKGITDYRLVDFKKINDADTKEREEYARFRKGVDFTITGSPMDNDLLLFIGECITSDVDRYSHLINKYYSQMDDDLESRENDVSGLSTVINRINTENQKIEFERFNKTVTNAIIDSLKRLKSSNPYKSEQDESIKAEKTERLETIIRDYYLNNLKFSKVLAEVRQKITDNAVNKQGAKR